MAQLTWQAVVAASVAMHGSSSPKTRLRLGQKPAQAVSHVGSDETGIAQGRLRAAAPPSKALLTGPFRLRLRCSDHLFSEGRARWEQPGFPWIRFCRRGGKQNVKPRLAHRDRTALAE